MATSKPRASRKAPDPFITISSEQRNTLRQAFCETFRPSGQISHTAFNEECIRVNHCKTEHKCSKARKCKAFSTESRRKLVNNVSLQFRQSSLEALCQILFKTSFLEWHKSFTSPSPQLVKVHTHKTFQEIVTEALIDAKSEIWFFNYSLEGTLAVNPNLYAEALKRGANINILFLDPTSQNLQSLASTLGCTREATFSFCDQSLHHAVQLLKELTEILKDENTTTSPNLGSITIKLTQNPPRLGVYIADPESENGKAYIVPSVNQTLMEHLPIFEFRNTTKGVYTYYLQGIKKEWNLSSSIQNHLLEEPYQRYLNAYPSLLDDWPDEVSNPAS